MDSKDYFPPECSTVAKLLINDNKEAYYIIVRWGEEINLTLVKKDEYWRAMIAPENFSHFYENLDISKEQYLINTKKALSSNSNDNPYVFEFRNNELCWKVIEKTSNVKITHGLIKITEHFKDGGTNILIDTLLQMKDNAENKLKHQEQESAELAKQLSIVIDKCQDFSKLKSEMENDLYVKFLTILNTKKEQVANMEEFINGIKRDNKFTTKVPALKSTVRQVHAMSDSGSDSDD